jgi:hypothetical protein
MVSGLQQLGADTSAFDLPSPPPSMPIASAIGQGLERAGVARKDVWPQMLAYCSSDVVERLPFIRVAASLWATFAAQSSTRAEPPGQGLTNDVSIVSTLIPYCDAMFVDRECYGLLNNIPKSHRTTYGCQVFSLTNRDAFLEYLREMERAAPAGHLADVAEVYGDSVDRPSVLFKRSV